MVEETIPLRRLATSSFSFMYLSLERIGSSDSDCKRRLLKDSIESRIESLDYEDDIGGGNICP